MNVLYEETGSFKVAAVLTEHDASLHVEAPHGKRVKIKSANVLLRFDDARLDTFLDRAEAIAQHLDLMRAGLHMHHTGEDEILWPLLLARASGVPVCVARRRMNCRSPKN